MVLGNLSTHPDIRQLKNRVGLQQAKTEVQSSLRKLEVLKPRINKRYDRYQELVRSREAAKSPGSTAEGDLRKPQDGSSYQAGHARLPSDPALAGGAETLAAGENKDLAVELAHKEIRRRATARKATRQAGISEEEEHMRRTAGLWGNWEEAFTKNDQAIDQDTLSRQMQNVRLQVNGSDPDGAHRGSSRPSFESQRSNFHYPAVPQPSAYDSSLEGSRTKVAKGSEPDLKAPLRPPKSLEQLSNEERLPFRPAKEATISDTSLGWSTEQPLLPEKDLKPSTFSFKPSAYLENGAPLRTIFLPPDLRHRFLELALPNTRANLETCGMLCGTLISNALFISKLVIPEQESTSDTCETVNESDFFDFVDGEDLMVLGWIHTHPTQTCFMSSRDLHTHCGYQVMMAESIAIVCAPSKGEYAN